MPRTPIAGAPFAAPGSAPPLSMILISLAHRNAAASHRADQAGCAELNTSRYSPVAAITPSNASAAAASPAVAALRLAASAYGSRHTVSLIRLPEDQSAYSSACPAGCAGS